MRVWAEQHRWWWLQMGLALQAVRQTYAEVGRAHLHGCGVPQSDERAARFWGLAAEQGDPDAAFALAGSGSGSRFPSKAIQALVVHRC
jgi:TPR repeat protein